MLGAFFYGYIVLQIPGGYLALRYGGTRVFGWAMLFGSLLTLLTPLAARLSVWALVVLRILEGVFLVRTIKRAVNAFTTHVFLLL